MGEKREGCGAEEGCARRKEAFWGGEGGGGEVEKRGRGGECGHCWVVLLVVLWFDLAEQSMIRLRFGQP